MKRIGRYTICGLLGRGGMGKVYKVSLPTIHKVGALKLLDPDPMLQKMMGLSTLRDRFVNEACILAGLSHPNIVAIHDFDEALGKPFYVMNYYPGNLGAMMGESYRVEARSRKFSVEKALHYTRQTLEGLACLHHAGIIHRDVKPFNLLVTAGDGVKLCDFGLSKLRGESFAGPANLNVGSPYYAAPEQETNPDAVAAGTDLYPVGVMLYRMLTGTLPNLGGRKGKYVAVDRFNPDLDSTWDTLVLQAIAPDPHKRFADAETMRRAVDQLAHHFQQRKENQCALSSAPNPSPEKAPSSTAVRTHPMKIRPGKARLLFDLDALWRPTAYTANRFRPPLRQTIADNATGLTWQQAGSRYPVTWHQAKMQVAQLNDMAFGGRTRWRLPTISELATLLRPHPQGEALCIELLFDERQRWLWSADRRSFTAAYYVDVQLGFVGWQDFDAPYYVRAVCTDNPTATGRVSGH
ncbi:MAG: DUF1566 domain-containing protein [Desulfatitalea sp.]|nr:DUF1566 domain-containing protein [Desulfatitalea sp.]NNK00757.1 DUF1566 domain-containing protein [Desulfatitalea sp.]